MSPKVPEQSKNNSKFLAFMSILAALQVVAGGLAVLSFVPADISGLMMLVVAAANVGMTYYLNGQLVPLDNVVAYQPNKLSNPSLYAGGASVERTGDMLPVNAKIGTLAEQYIIDDKAHPDGY